AEGIGINSRTLTNVGADIVLKTALLHVRHHGRADGGVTLGVPLEKALDRGLPKGLVTLAGTPTVDDALALAVVHVPGLPADVGFIHFDGSAEFPEGRGLHGKPDPVEHEPSGLLSKANGSANLIGRDAVLGIGDEPNARKPFPQGEGGILKDGP